jgi:uncharacterized oxidoreductase
MNLNGKRVLITGGSSGIGLAIAEAILAKGARVVVTGRRPNALKVAIDGLRKSGGSVDGVAADVGTDKGRATTLAFALEKFCGLDVLINDAGGVRAGRLEETTEDDIRTMIEVDLVAYLPRHPGAPKVVDRKSTQERLAPSEPNASWSSRTINHFASMRSKY